MSTKKTGRPFSLSPLDVDCKVRFTAEQVKRIDRAAKNNGITRAAYIRIATLQALDKETTGKGQ